jgi:hypothetical protein
VDRDAFEDRYLGLPTPEGRMKITTGIVGVCVPANKKRRSRKKVGIACPNLTFESFSNSTSSVLLEV